MAGCQVLLAFDQPAFGDEAIEDDLALSLGDVSFEGAELAKSSKRRDAVRLVGCGHDQLHLDR
jgi:hypothetical protein